MAWRHANFTINGELELKQPKFATPRHCVYASE